MELDLRTTAPPLQSFARRLPIGAEVQPGGGVHFRVWAPDWKRVDVVLESVGEDNQADCPLLVPMIAEVDGYYSAFAAGAATGARYRYRLGGKSTFPDPASRRQPEGPHGPSEVVAPDDYVWHDSAWQGVSLPGQVIYEMHIGTFTPEGTFAAAARELASLATLGITVVEIMPVNEFDGQFGWGYDGVDLFAPTRLYGSPDELRRFVDEAHIHGVAVILDVVYNHFGPNGNYATTFAQAFNSRKHKTDWGDAINFDGEQSKSVREFFVANAGYWIEEFHFDGLRIDAIQAIVDDSPEHILATITRRVRQASQGRETLVVGENEFQQSRLVRSPAENGYGLDAVWNDDFHHVMRVAATGHNEFYYADYQGTPQEMISAVKWGYLYQGQWNARQGRPRGTPAWDLAAMRFITFLQNHDQVANSAQGLRMQLLTSPGRYRALTALFLLGPALPCFSRARNLRRLPRSSSLPTMTSTWRNWCARGARSFSASLTV